MDRVPVMKKIVTNVELEEFNTTLNRYGNSGE